MKRKSNFGLRLLWALVISVPMFILMWKLGLPNPLGYSLFSFVFFMVASDTRIMPDKKLNQEEEKLFRNTYIQERAKVLAQNETPI